MVPTLPPNTLVIGLRWRQIKPGHVVVATHDDKEKIKRIEDMRDDEVFLVGDHPESSTDSRHFGWLPTEDVLVRIIWPRT